MLRGGAARWEDSLDCSILFELNETLRLPQHFSLPKGLTIQLHISPVAAPLTNTNINYASNNTEVKTHFGSSENDLREEISEKRRLEKRKTGVASDRDMQ